MNNNNDPKYLGEQSGTVTLDLNKSRIFRLRAVGNVVFELANWQDKSGNLIIFFEQDEAGSRTASFSSDFRKSTDIDPTADTTANETTKYTINLAGTVAEITAVAQDIKDIMPRIIVNYDNLSGNISQSGNILRVLNTNASAAENDVIADLSITTTDTPTWTITEHTPSGSAAIGTYAKLSTNQLQLGAQYFTDQAADINSRTRLTLKITGTAGGYTLDPVYINLDLGYPGTPALTLTDEISSESTATAIAPDWDIERIIAAGTLASAHVSTFVAAAPYALADLSTLNISGNSNVSFSGANNEEVVLDINQIVTDAINNNTWLPTLILTAKNSSTGKLGNTVSIAPANYIGYEFGTIIDTNFVANGLLTYDWDITVDPGASASIAQLTKHGSAPAGDINFGTTNITIYIDDVEQADEQFKVDATGTLSTGASWNTANYANATAYVIKIEFTDQLLGGQTVYKEFTINITK